jgi:F0F1-type ATP synthase assembly protein I
MSKRTNQQSNDAMAMASRVGCFIPLVSVLIIGAAAAVGYALDQWLGTENVFFIIAIVASFPVTLFAIIRVSLYLVQRYQPEDDEATIELTQEQGE